MNIVTRISGHLFVFCIAIVVSCSETETLSVTTTDITEITETTAKSGGVIGSEGTDGIVSRGVCWNTTSNPDINDAKTSDGSGSGEFISNIAQLTPATNYYVRAFAENDNGVTYGDEKNFTTSARQSGFIIADHRVVAEYEKIPQNYIDLVKRMWLTVPGESHSGGYRLGLQLLKSADAKFQVNITESGSPEGYSDQHLRASCATWGDIDNATGWIYSYGEQDWFTSAQAIARTKAGITYCNTNNLTISAMGFAWCYDPYIEVGEDITMYLNATQEYIDYCKSNKYPTKIFFTTGPVDEWYTGQFGYDNYRRYEQIRAYVLLDSTRILFDYADILCYDDDGTTSTETWENHTYPAITTKNYLPTTYYHISEAGALRLGKAMWWMLARIAGWDGK